MFIKYMHLERFGNDEVEGIEMGETYVFPKLDGTNAQVWLEDGSIKAGSRNRVLSLDNDNAGFYNAIIQDEKVRKYLNDHPNFTLYGEWLVPHSLKTYRDDAWRRFYIFDVYCRSTETFLHYNDFKGTLDAYSLDYLAPLAIIRNGTREDFERCLEKNVFLIQEGQGVGEGIVIKNYSFTNRFGNVVWAKMVTNAFKEVHHKEMGAPLIGGISTEEQIVNQYVTSHLIDKVHAKIVNEEGGWKSQYIPRLLQTVYYDLITEEMWAILKEYKNPKIDFSFLQRLSIAKVKELKKEVFTG